MRHNPHVSPTKVNHNPSTGNGKPLVKPPANNFGTMKVPLGTTKGSKIVGNSNGISSGKAGTVNSKGTQPNSTNYVNTGQKAKMGNTMHGVGEVPAYLKNPQNPKQYN